MDINGKVVLVTGASSGIGAATARAAAAAGAKVVLVARREDRITALAGELGDVAIAVRADVTDAAQVRHAVDTAVEAFGGIDVLINNAGQAMTGAIADVDVEDFRAIVDLNMVAPLIVMQASIPVLREQGESAIVNVSSGVTLMAVPGSATYSSSKSGLNQLSAVARNELKDDGITVSTIYPFVTDTELYENMRGAAPHEESSGWRPTPHTAEHVAEGILALITSGDAELSLLPAEWDH
ncbi:SDR family NAD(P)-dependent oxidoreductase [Cellulomonas humilata]|uniref:SDR family NAD(P)-dependent oxidoreductase n=1 Tax=Cellulomonas humilata TaxID=144055 RepID=A0A7Y6DWD6_9CELL|nr:SDR family NAD(P)-dependent oxidoreductase [Cellulomonas humilata]NUU15804.1 SDR family NAD(P)-dependent oxidoreductase [Cellulomonas humilata]